jgi:phospholipase C
MPPIEHVFVLMLENRSFDHMLGVSPFTGIDAVTQTPTQINALPAGVSNSWNGHELSCWAASRGSAQERSLP